MDEKLTILIIDDDPIYRRLSQSILQERFNVLSAEKPSSGLSILKSQKIDYVICDYRLPEMNGLELLKQIKDEYPLIEVIMISDSGDMNTVIEALRKGAIDYFKKPFTAADLWMSIERTHKFVELNKSYIEVKNKNRHLKEIVDREFGVEIIGKSKLLNDIKTQIRLVAQTPDTSVLILGESGTGKELVARAIHNLSRRKDEFYGAVNMSAIPENLFESEFFGHKKGSFTGAISEKAGWFETCNKGTLFLDEIGDMTHALQVKLLRVLEERTFTKVGAQNSQKFDIRLITATNKPVEEISDNDFFRSDLFHRIGTFIIYLAPLRERKEDIPLIVDHFVEQYSIKLGKTIKKVHPEVYEILNNYSFPGNIRELRNIIERAIILSSNMELTPANFSITEKSLKSKNSRLSETFNLEEIEKQIIIKALHKTKNNKTEAAKLLNIEWNALYRRLQKYNIEV